VEQKWLNFCGSKTTMKKLEVEANSEATNFIQSWKQKQKILLLPHLPGDKHLRFFTAKPQIKYFFVILRYLIQL